MLRLPLALLCLSAPAASQTTWYVDVNGTPPGTGTALDPYTSIDFALSQPTTLSGDLVLVLPGTYQETVSFAAKGVTVMSTGGAANTVIDAGGLGSAVSFLGTDGTAMKLDGFAVRGGSGTPTGSWTEGGGVYGVDAVCDVVRCVIEANDAAFGGGLGFRDCVASVRRTTVQDNTTTDSGPGGNPVGGGIAVSGGALNVVRSAVLRNVSGTQYALPGRGGGVHVSGGAQVTLVASRVKDNRAESQGGGVLGPAVIDRCTISGNSSQFGGGICGAADVVDSLLENNQADTLDEDNNWGGAAQGGTTLTDCTVRNNEAFGSGGAADDAVLVGCLVTGNRSYAGDIPFGHSAGGVDDSLLVDCQVSGNVTNGGFVEPARGGGAAMSTLVDCDLHDNRVIGSPFGNPVIDGGGGAWSSTLTGCRIFDNDTDDHGGGVYESTLDSCELFGNTALRGGGAADSDLDRCTVYGNSAQVGGGLFSWTGASAVNSIFWNNGVEIDGPAAAAVTYSDVEGGFAGVGNIDADPLFWDEGANDFHLQASSPCIDAGNPASTPDPDGSVADMGAHPFDPSYTGS